jgi:hypothetical protein
MAKKEDKRDIPLTAGDLYPDLTSEQLQEAEENLEAYLGLALRIFERICEDPHLYAEFKYLTGVKAAPIMQDAKSKSPHESYKSAQE